MSAPDEVHLESNEIAFAFPGTARRVRHVMTALLVVTMVAFFSSEALERVLGTDAIDVPDTLSAFMLVEMFAWFVAQFFVESRTAVAGRIRAGRDGIEITLGKKTRFIPAADFARGAHSVMPARVEFVRRNGDTVRFAAHSRAEAESVLRVLGLDAARRSLEFDTSNGPDTLTRGIAFAVLDSCVAGALALGVANRVSESRLVPFFLATWATLLGVSMLATARPRIAIGTDGIRVKRPLRTEYFAFDGLSVEVRNAADLVLVRPDGRARRFDLRGLSDNERFALHDRISQAREARARLRSDEAASQQIERKGRTIADWKRDLAQLVKSANDYRTSSLSIGDLVQIVSDPSARAERRIGAAVALRAKDDEAAITRVRVAADACVSEPVRRALQKAADDALDEVDLRAAIESEARRA